MKKQIFHNLLGLTLLLLSLKVYASVDWAYNDSGPTHWPEDFEICATGFKQSPIDISDFIVSKKPSTPNLPDKISFSPNMKKVKIFNNGHTIMMQYLEDYIFHFSGRNFLLKQMHFHHLSETTIDGQHSPLEIHFVHQGPQGALLVVGLLLKKMDIESKLLDLFDRIDKKPKGEALIGFFNASRLLPANMDYYRFQGSLTTPPCTESVEWLIIKERGTVSHQDVAFFEQRFFFANYRALQELNDRAVLDYN